MSAQVRSPVLLIDLKTIIIAKFFALERFNLSSLTIKFNKFWGNIS